MVEVVIFRLAGTIISRKKPRFNHTNDSGSIKPPRRGLSILEKVVVYTTSLANRYSGKIMLTNTSLIFFFFQ